MRVLFQGGHDFRFNDKPSPTNDVFTEINIRRIPQFRSQWFGDIRGRARQTTAIAAAATHVVGAPFDAPHDFFFAYRGRTGPHTQRCNGGTVVAALVQLKFPLKTTFFGVLRRQRRTS